MIASPMTRLLQKDVKFEWSDKCQQMLVQPKSNKEFIIYNDASLNGLGCVARRHLKPHERNYPTHDLNWQPLCLR
ncbi:hypothetical protein EPI10_021266 [Gossypium australe]|uniref:Uncharacterized protein n=1 Tax=Gossypium australe TaxID=47621 RepID=A0A5B6WGF2_9ROSI|nr:hypothetical protein EPI10_021266 [Gossypium australe]